MLGESRVNGQAPGKAGELSGEQIRLKALIQPREPTVPRFRRLGMPLQGVAEHLDPRRELAVVYEGQTHGQGQGKILGILSPDRLEHLHQRSRRDPIDVEPGHLQQ